MSWILHAFGAITAAAVMGNYLCAGRNAATIIAMTLNAKDTRKAW